MKFYGEKVKEVVMIWAFGLFLHTSPKDEMYKKI